MIDPSEFAIFSLQLVLITPDHKNFSRQKTLSFLLNKYSSIYDGAVQAIPWPTGAPAEVPQVVLQSADNHWKIQAGPARVDVIWLNNDINTQDETDVNTAFNTCISIVTEYSKEAKAPIGRLALVVTRVSKSDSPVSTIINTFVKDKLQEKLAYDSKDFEIHRRIESSIHIENLNLDVNIWTRIKNGVLEPINRPVILVEQDINTHEQYIPSNTIQYFHVKSFFIKAMEEANTVVANNFV